MERRPRPIRNQSHPLAEYPLPDLVDGPARQRREQGVYRQDDDGGGVGEQSKYLENSRQQVRIDWTDPRCRPCGLAERRAETFAACDSTRDAACLESKCKVIVRSRKKIGIFQNMNPIRIRNATMIINSSGCRHHGRCADDSGCVEVFIRSGWITRGLDGLLAAR